MTTEPLTTRQQQILAFIRRHVAGRGYPPSYREIGAAVGLESAASVQYQLGQMERKGWLRRNRRLPRAIVLTEAAR